jgi:Zn-dependent M28 family amino/carboxypeptidase
MNRLFALLAAFIVSARISEAAAQFMGPANPESMSTTVKVLASETFQGRAPGTKGEFETIQYLIERLKALKLEPGGENGGWTQSIALVRTHLGVPTTLEVNGPGAAVQLVSNEDIIVSTARPVDRVSIRDAPMVFVGYGVSAPERDWDDFKGVDLHGKVAVFLDNDPDSEAAPSEAVAGKFGGRARTYYGRWTYKYEEAARRGAVAALIVHEAGTAPLSWSTLLSSQGVAYDIFRPANAPQAILLGGYLRDTTTIRLFRMAGLDFEALKSRARRADFQPVQLEAVRFTANIPVAHEQVSSVNVLAKLTGTVRPDETVMFSAHWDAYGIGAPDAKGRTIRPGANDDGLGVAGVLEIAKGFTVGPHPQRTVVFALWTAEESGLLGSEAYAVNPIYPLATTVADLDMDILQTAGPSHDVVLVGAGQNSLESDLVRAASTQGRSVTPEKNVDKGFFYRADHFSLAKRGVPTLVLMAPAGGPDLVVGGISAGDRWVNDYMTNCYHKTCDAWSPDWDLRGAAQDVNLLFDIGRHLANSDTWPTWSSTSEFAAVRGKTASARR